MTRRAAPDGGDGTGTESGGGGEGTAGTGAGAGDPDDDGEWVSLFSGGKDSSWALHRARAAGLNVTRLLTVHPGDDSESYMYHVPETRLAGLAAESVGLPLVEVDVDDATLTGTDAAARGDAELEPLEAALRDLQREVDLAGVTAGAVESAFQTSRLRDMCERLGIDLYAPLWGEEPRALARAMLDAGFEILIVQVAADGLDESWLGRRLDADALADLERLNDERGVHVLGEGGEFETLVVDGPHMDRRLDLSYDVEWRGTRGRIRVRDARLADD
jgi:ABC transporter with metal-binding/Fe-S-binding domain ATP-binding protein